MSTSFIGALIILFSMLISLNVIMATLDEPGLLAWLNQIFLGIIFIAIVSYLIVWLGTRKTEKKEEMYHG